MSCGNVAKCGQISDFFEEKTLYNGFYIYIGNRQACIYNPYVHELRVVPVHNRLVGKYGVNKKFTNTAAHTKVQAIHW